MSELSLFKMKTDFFSDFQLANVNFTNTAQVLNVESKKENIEKVKWILLHLIIVKLLSDCIRFL